MNNENKNCESPCPFYGDIILTKRDVSDMKSDITEIKNNLQDFIKTADIKYVQKIEFVPIKKVVYGAVAITLLAVITALFTLILK